MIDLKKFLNMKQLFKRKKIVIVVIVLILVILAVPKVLGGAKAPGNMQSSANAITVETETVKYSNSMGGLTYKVNLEPAEEATVSSNVSGQVTQVYFENGDRVSQGQILAYLDDKDLQNQLRTAKLDLTKLQLELDSAKSDYDIAEQLYAEGACSKTSYDSALRTYKTVQANVELKKINIQDISNSLSDCAIKAPIAGEAGNKSIEVGQYLNPGTVIGSVKNNVEIKAEIQLMQDDLSKVTVGQEVTLKLSQDDTMEYKGTVDTIAASANSQSRAFNCLIKIDNIEGTLNSGVFGYIEIPNQDKKEVLVVPMSAVSGSEGAYSVFTIDHDTARKISVEIGEITNDMVEITSGLKEGDTIITTNLNSLQDGDKVSVEGDASAPPSGEGE